MKKTAAILMIVLLTVIFSESPSVAYPVYVNDIITMKDGPGQHPGGEFKIYKASNFIFSTFCMEAGEYANFNDSFKVVGIGTHAVKGGQPESDPLDERTAYLFYHFAMGTLQGYDYGAGRADSATALQNAIWFIEGEGGEDNAFVQLAIDKTGGTKPEWDGLGNVRVLNLQWASGQSEGTNAQDVLTLVPEPLSFLLLGAGLVGLAALRRRACADRA